jgi:fucose 4-O-acetylase-like acetyltransferase
LILLDLFFAARIDFNTRLYESFVINTLEAVSGILFVLALSRQIELHISWLASVFKYFGKISLILLLFHVPIQDYWGQKIFAVTDNQTLSIWLAFCMGVLGSALIYELFIKMNPVASFWFGREAELPKKEAPVPVDVMQTEEEKQPAVQS